MFIWRFRSVLWKNLHFVYVLVQFQRSFRIIISTKYHFHPNSIAAISAQIFNYRNPKYRLVPLAPRKKTTLNCRVSVRIYYKYTCHSILLKECIYVEAIDVSIFYSNFIASMDLFDALTFTVAGSRTTFQIFIMGWFLRLVSDWYGSRESQIVR